jgi:SAM-dependent methyltransferase
MFTRRRWELADEEVDGVIRLTGAEAGADVLDLCCGPGRHALALGERGFRVTGVDRTASYIAAANERAAKADADLTFLVDDAREYRSPGKFDVAVCLYTSFGYFETIEEDTLLLRNVCESLKAGGAFVLDINGKEVVQRVFKETWSEDSEDGFRMTEVRTVGPEWDWI